MASKEDIIRGALQRLGVLGPEEWPQAADRATAARKLLDVVEYLGALGLAPFDLGDGDVIAYDDSDRIPQAAKLGLERLLAAELAEYGPPDVDPAAMRAEGLQMLTAALAQSHVGRHQLVWY